MPETDIDQLVAFLRQNRGKASPEALRQRLVEQGYDVEGIDVALGIVQLESRKQRSWGPRVLLALGISLLLASLCLMAAASSQPSFPRFSSSMESSFLEHVAELKKTDLPMVEPVMVLGLVMLLGLLLMLCGLWPGLRDLTTVGLILFLGASALAAIGLLAVGSCIGVLNALLTESQQARQEAFTLTWSMIFIGLALFALIGVTFIVWSILLSRRALQESAALSRPSQP